MAKTNVVKQIRKATRRKFSAEDKIRVVLGWARRVNMPAGVPQSPRTPKPRRFGLF